MMSALLHAIVNSSLATSPAVSFLPKVEWPWSHEVLDHVISDECPPLLMFGDDVLENSNQLFLHLSCQHPTTAILLHGQVAW